MSNVHTSEIAVIGGGIVGLAHAYMALRKGYKVVLFEREPVAVGASVRNFGMIWPIGQLPGPGLERALRSRSHWQDIAKEAGIWLNPNGSLHLAYHEDEMNVLREFVALYRDSGYRCELISRENAFTRSTSLRQEGLLGALWSDTESVVYPREAIRRIPLWLEEKYGLTLRFGHTVVAVEDSTVITSREKWQVSKIVVCSGADFETLYPTVFDEQQVTKCKLQMMKAVFRNGTKSIGPSLCAGLTLRHYSAFSECPSLKILDERYDRLNPAFKNEGVHVLVSQNAEGELIIGDSHHYGKTVEPFDREQVDQLILSYLDTFLHVDELKIVERWHGVYPKLPGQLGMVIHPEPGVTIVNGLGGAGMTLSLGLAEEVIDSW